MFLSSPKVGKTWRVIDIDLTPEMISKARLIKSNCMINLSPNKAQLFNETYCILKTGGRLVISDVVLTATLPVKNTKCF